ncbi:MAG: hypothetical protein ACPLRP_06170 [Candidatus Bipolaricaulaceae bacterium]
MLVAYTERVGFFQSVVSGSLSENHGETFTYLGQLSPCPACPHQWSPALAVSEEGIFYLLTIDDQARISRSLDGGKSFVPAFSLKEPALFYPQLLVVGQKIYVLGTDLLGGQIVLFTMENEVVTGPIVVAQENAVLGRLVELHGVLYCVFLRWPRAPLGLLPPFAIPDGLAGLGQDLVRQFCLANPAELCLSVSEDGGRTWRPPVCLGQIAIPYHVEEKVVSFISGGLEAPLLPNAGVDPKTGTIYIAYQSATDAGKIEVNLMAVNQNLEVTLSPRPIGGKTHNERFLPAIAVTEGGEIGIAFYELDPVARKIDVYLGQSDDGGQTFRFRRVNSVSSPIPPVAGQPTRSGHFERSFYSGYIGESLGIATDENFFYLAWVDFRNIITTPDYPEGRPDFDVYFRKVPIQWGAGSH